MITSKGKAYNTIKDAADELGVSAKAIQTWIDRKIIDAPPTFEYGLRTVRHYPREYIQRVKQQVQDHRDHRNSARKR